MSKIKNIGFSIGYTSFVMVFVILIFVAFSALSYTQANSDLKHIDKTINIISENYTADTKAMEVRMQIEQLLGDDFSPEVVQNELKNEINSIIVSQNSVSYTIIINDKAQLSVELELDYTQKSTIVKKWIVENINNEEYNQKGFDL